MVYQVLTALFLSVSCLAANAPGRPPDALSDPQIDAAAPPSDHSGPLVVLGNLPGPEDAPDPEQKLADLIRDREALAPEDSLELVPLLLASSSIRLAQTAEPAATRYLLGIDTDQDRAAWLEIATEALAELELVGETLDRLPDPVDEEEEAAIERWIAESEVLESFARIFAALASLSDESDPSEISSAAIELSEFLEDEDREIARAATLWQAVALRKMNRPDRAFDLLDKPLSPPGNEPMAFFNRLERIRCLADLGDVQAALVLAIRMEEAANRWYRDETRQLQAQRAATLVRLQLCQKENDSVGQLVQDAPASDRWTKMCDRIRTLLTEDEPPRTVVRLGTTMPIVFAAQIDLPVGVKIPDPDADPPEQDPPPADDELDQDTEDEDEDAPAPQDPAPDAPEEDQPD